MVNLIVVSEVVESATTPTEPYTRESLGQTLSFMGCKQRHAFKVAQRVFDTLALIGGPAAARVQSQLRGRFPRGQLRGAIYKGDTAFLTRSQLFAIVGWALAEYRYTKPDQMDDLAIACRRGSRAHLSTASPRRQERAAARPRQPSPLLIRAQGPRAALVRRHPPLRDERHWKIHSRCAPGAARRDRPLPVLASRLLRRADHFVALRSQFQMRPNDRKPWRRSPHDAAMPLLRESAEPRQLPHLLPALR